MREIDLVEELARFRLDAIPFTLPQRTAMFGRLSREQRLRRLVEDVLAGAGFSEAYTPSLVSDDADAVQLSEPLTSEHIALRTSLLPSLVQAAQRNLDSGNRDVALFELARVYLRRDDDLPDERWHVAGVAAGGLAVAKRAVEQLYGALRVELVIDRGKHELFHPGRTARLAHGVFGELRLGLLDGSWGGFELDLDALFRAAPERVQFEDLLSFPAVHQDLAFVVADAVTAAELISAMRDAAGPELRDVRVFDEYRSDELGPGSKSLAFAVSFQSPERTLTDEDAAQLRRRVVDALAERFGAELRA